MNDLGPPITIGTTRLIPKTEGGRAEMLLPVDGVEQWREAHWVREEMSRMCDRRGQHVEYGLVCKPRLYDGEELRETAMGPVAIVTVDARRKAAAIAKGELS